jgi:alpha-tubulin suppressor-like RCC1 family protein/chitodextrinase
MALVGLFLASWLGAAYASAAVTKVASGEGHTVFIKSDGTLWGFGNNLSGQLGVGRGTQQPAQVTGGTNVVAAAAGGYFTMFLKSDGTLWGAGINRAGQLGNGEWNDNTFLPTQVNGGTNVTDVSTGYAHTVFVRSDGTLWATGDNSGGQLGDGTNTNRSIPVQVSGGTNVTAIAAGDIQTFFIKSDGTLWAMGDNSYGQLGDGTITSRNTPVQVVGGTNVVRVAAGSSHTAFLKTDGTLWVTGRNSYGQLGDGTWTDRSTPVQVGTGVAAIAAGGRFTLFLKTDGTLWSMGDNTNGQLGDGTTNPRKSPVQVSGGADVAVIAAGSTHALFIKTNGSFWGMGSNSLSQLGDSIEFGALTPALINDSIVFMPISSPSLAAGSTLNFTVSATDADNNTLTYSAANLPSGATFTPATRSFNWVSLPTQVGTYNVTFSVTDGAVTISRRVSITMTDGTPPTIPTGLSGIGTSPTRISLTWTPSTDNVGVIFYRVYRNGTQIGTTSSTSFSDSGLQTGTTYNYTVDAMDNSNNASAKSASVSVAPSLTGPQTRYVTNASTLSAALAESVANPSATFTINLAAGTYSVGGSPLPNLSVAGTTVQGPLSEPYAIIDGDGLAGGVVFSVTASNVTISGVIFRNVASHAITIQPHADSGRILGCSFYGTGATAAILGRGCTNWIVAVNELYNIAGTVATAEPAIYFYEGCASLSVANNLIQDCDRGIGFGAGATENNGSVWIFNNMIADTRTVSHGGPGISVASITSSGSSIDNNTVYQVGSYANAIEYNNNSATITLRNNLTNKAITGSNSPSVVTATNNTAAVAAWFRDPNDGDLRLASAVPGVVNAGTTISGLTIDIEGDARPSGLAFDIGADEYIQPVSPNPPPSPNPPAPASSGDGGGGGGAPSVAYWLALIALGLARGLRQARR